MLNIPRGTFANRESPCKQEKIFKKCCFFSSSSNREAKIWTLLFWNWYFRIYCCTWKELLHSYHLLPLGNCVFAMSSPIHQTCNQTGNVNNFSNFKISYSEFPIPATKGHLISPQPKSKEGSHGSPQKNKKSLSLTKWWVLRNSDVNNDHEKIFIVDVFSQIFNFFSAYYKHTKNFHSC